MVSINLLHFSFLPLILLLLTPCTGWRAWDYTSTTPDDWKDTWGFSSGPRGRRGHTMVLSEGTKLIMFGGRDNEMQRQHVPKTYNIEEIEGALEFQTYTDYPVKENYNASCKPKKTCVELTDATSGNTEACEYQWDDGSAEGKSRLEIMQKEEECG